MTRTETHTNKTILRVILAGIAVLILCGVFCGATAAAGGDNYQIIRGDVVFNTYSTLSDAYEDAAESGDTIKVLQNVTETAQTTMSDTKSVTLDLNGKTITAGDGTFTDALIKWNSTGTLTITDRSDEENGSLNGGNKTRVLYISAGTVQMKVGTITGGRAKEGGGVFVCNSSGKFTMTGGTITGNTASTSGGGVCVEAGGTFEMTGGTITGNTASTSGGGVYVYPSATFMMSGTPVITGNTKETGDEVTANNVFLFKDKKIIITSALKDDHKTAKIGVNPEGGAASGATFTTDWKKAGDINPSTVFTADSGDYAAMVDGSGEVKFATANYAVYNTSTTPETLVGKSPTLEDAYELASNDNTIKVLKDVTEAGCTTMSDTKSVTLDLNGNAIRPDPSDYSNNLIVWSSTGTLTITDSSENNTGMLDGYSCTNPLNVGGTVVLIAGTITQGFVPGANGGGVYVDNGGVFRMEGGKIIRNVAAYGDSAYGGGVYVKGKFNMTGGTIGGGDDSDANKADVGGGVYVDNGGVFNMSGDAKIIGNTAAYGGGVFVANSGQFNMTGGTIGGSTDAEANTAACGGGVFVDDDGTFEMSGNAKITINKSTGTDTDSGGGGVYVKGKFNMTSGTIGGSEYGENRAEKNGGGVYVGTGATFTMSAGSITKNTSSDSGGGVYVADLGEFTMSGTASITKNKTGSWGGGVYVNGTFTMTGGTLSENKVESDSGDGSGVYVDDGGTFNISGTPSITGNTKGTGDEATANNVYLETQITITGELKDDTGTAKIGVYPDGAAKPNMDPFTMGWDRSSSVDPSEVFTADSGGYEAMVAESEVKFGEVNYAVYNTSTTPETLVGKSPTLQEAYALALNGNTIKVLKDVTEESQASMTSDKSVTLDLKGKTIAATDSLYNLIYISNGKLTIIDSSGDMEEGRLVGADGPRALFIDGTATVEMNAGTITGGSAYYGGGVYVCENGVFTMSGTASITGNTAAQNGGGVYNQGTFTISETASITGNTAGTNGGGVYVDKGVFNVSGTPSIKDNTKGTGEGAPANNVWLVDEKTLTVTGPLSGEIHITSSLTAGTMFAKAGVPVGSTGEYTIKSTDAARFIPDQTPVTVKAIVKTASDSPKTSLYWVSTEITLNGVGTAESQTTAASSGTKLLIPDSGFTAQEKTGYTFAGWGPDDAPAKALIVFNNGALTLSEYSTDFSDYLDTEGNWKYSNDTLELNPVLTANKYTVTLDSQEGSGGTESVVATYDSAMPDATMPTKTGYTFGGYYDATGGSGTQYYKEDGTSAHVWDKTAAATLYAKWTADEYAITYKDQGGAAFSGTHEEGHPEKHTYGTETVLKGATKTGYTFGGWFESSDCTGDAVTKLGATDYTENITLYAKWEPTMSDTITFNGTEYSSGAVISAEYKGKNKEGHTLAASSDIPEDQGYTMAWSKNGQAVNGISSTQTITNVSDSGTWTAKLLHNDEDTGKSVSATVTITPRSLTKTDVVIDTIEDVEWVKDGSPFAPASITVEDDSETLTENEDYTAAYSGNTEVTANAKVTITGKENYTGDKEQTYRIILKIKADGTNLQDALDYISAHPTVAPGLVSCEGCLTVPSGVHTAPTEATKSLISTILETVTSGKSDFTLDVLSDGSNIAAVIALTDTHGGESGVSVSVPNPVTIPENTQITLTANNTSVVESLIRNASDASNLTLIISESSLDTAAALFGTPGMKEKNVKAEISGALTIDTADKLTSLGTILSNANPASKQGLADNSTVTEGVLSSLAAAGKEIVRVLYDSTTDSAKKYTYRTYLTSTVTFDKTGGSGGDDSVTAQYDTEMPEATMPTKTGYTFGGYYDTATGGTQYYNADGSSAKLWDSVADTTLYAKWTKNSSGTPSGSSTWIQPLPPVTGDNTVSTDITYQYAGQKFTPVSTANFERISAADPAVAAAVEAVLETAAAHGIPLTNSKGAKALVNTTDSIPGAQTETFSQVIEVTSADGSKVTSVPFKVHLSDLSAKNLTTDDVTLYHFIEEYNIWIPLETGLVSTDVEYACYEAATDGASPFGVLLKKLDAPEVKPVSSQTAGAKTPAPFMGVLAGLGAAAILFRRKRK